MSSVLWGVAWEEYRLRVLLADGAAGNDEYASKECIHRQVGWWEIGMS